MIGDFDKILCLIHPHPYYTSITYPQIFLADLHFHRDLLRRPEAEVPFRLFRTDNDEDLWLRRCVYWLGEWS